MSRQYFAGTAPRALAAALCLTAATGLAQLAKADETSDNEVIIVGRAAAAITVAPRGLAVSLGQTEFEAINAVNVEDLMKYAPNFFVRKRFAGDDNAVVALRGANTVQSARTIVLVDGFLVSNFLGNRYDYPPKWNVVGPAEVRQFDIVYGPYSARYGGNSMGGVISVTTREPQGTSYYATAQTMIMPFKEYGIDQTFNGYSFEGGGTYRAKDSPLSLRAGFRHFDNTGQPMSFSLLTPATGSAAGVAGAYVDPRLATPVFGAASPVHVIQDQLRLRLGYETDNGWTISALGSVWTTDQDLSDPLSTLTNAADSSPVYQGNVRFGDQVWSAKGLNFSQTQRTEYLAGVKIAGNWGGWKLRSNVSRYWIAKQDTRTSKDYLTGASDGAGTQVLQDAPGWWAADANLERGLGLHTLAAGVNASLYQATQDTYSTRQWKQASNRIYSASTYGKSSLLGVWAEDAVSLPGDYLLTAGLRLDAWRAFDGGIGKAIDGGRVDSLYPGRRDTSLSPKLSLQGPIPGNMNLQISLGSAVRFPTVGELFQGRIDDITRQIDPQSFDPNLRPEKSQDANLILRRQFGTVRSTFSLFYQNIDDAIFSFSGLNAYGNVVTSYKNVDQVRQVGAELMLEATDLFIAGLDIDANASWMDAKTLKNSADRAAEGVKFPRIPDWRSNGNIRYRVNEKLKLSSGWRYATRPNSDLLGLSRGDAYGFQSEYFTVDARASYDLNPHVQISAGIDNLFNDQAYVSHPLPQRSFVLDLKIKG